MNKLLKIIIEERPLKLWSERAHDDKIRLNHKIIKILNFISGNDLKSMLKDLFKNKKLQLGRFSREYRTLKKIAPHFNDKIKPKQKHFFLKGFVISRFTQKETKKFGFKFSKFLWNSCLNSRIRKPGGRPLYKNYMRKKIHNFLEYNSEISASRTTTHVFIPEKIRKPNGVLIKQKNTRIVENSRYLNNSLIELHKIFNEGVSKSTFFKYKSNKFKRAKRKTDLCRFLKFYIIN